MEDTTPVLKQKAEFESVLADYRPSDEAIKQLNKTKTLFLIGPTGSGRNTLIDELVKTGDFYYVLSDTTRPPRMKDGRLERNGESYWHITEDAFLDGLRAGRYLEAAIIHGQQVSGSNSEEYRKAEEQGKVATTDIEGIHGPPIFHEYSPSALFVFVVPPSFDEWMRRLNRRGKMAEQELRTRLSTAEKEIAVALTRSYYHFMVSRDIPHNVKAAMSIVKTGEAIDDEVEAHQRAEILLREIREYLGS